MRSARVLCVLVVGFAALAGCKDARLNPIKTLLDDPSQYDQQTVRIVGTVEDAAGIAGFGLYRLNDGTGTITVVTKQNGAPRSGATVGVEGEFRTAFTLGTESVAAVMEKKRFVPKD